MTVLVEQASPAQQGKARRFLALRLVRPAGVVEDNQGYGLPSARRETYEVHPLPGRHQVHRVTFTEHRDGAGQLRAQDRDCDCQRGTQLGKECSHTLAVHLYRTEKP